VVVVRCERSRHHPQNSAMAWALAENDIDLILRWAFNIGSYSTSISLS
jgi:hypothetical protein